MTELPAGWALVPIGDIVELNPKTVARDETKAAFSPMQALGIRFRDKVGFERRPWGEIKKSYVHFRDGDVLLAKITPCFENGKAGLASDLPSGIGAGSSEYFVCRADPEALDPRYLLAMFKTETFLRSGETRMTGSVGHKRVPKEYLVGTTLPLAPRAEQKRIADKLDALLARVDACRDRLDRVPALLKRFRDGVLSAAVRGSLTRAWRDSVGLGQLADAERSGPDLSRLNADAQPDEEELQEWLVELPDCWLVERAAQVVEPGADIVYGIVQPGPKLAQGVPYVRGMDIVDGAIRVNQLLRTSPAIAQRYARASIKGGDVLLGIIRATKVAVVPESLNGANITQGTARFRPSVLIRTRFLAAVLEAPETQRWLHGHYRGIDMPGLNLADVRRVPIPLPSLNEQAEIVRRVDALFALADALETKLATARAQVERLTPSLLAKAFRGELVPQDPNDEPASELLARLPGAAPAGAKPTPAANGRHRETKARAVAQRA